MRRSPSRRTSVSYGGSSGAGSGPRYAHTRSPGVPDRVGLRLRCFEGGWITRCSFRDRSAATAPTLTPSVDQGRRPIQSKAWGALATARGKTAMASSSTSLPERADLSDLHLPPLRRAANLDRLPGRPRLPGRGPDRHGAPQRPHVPDCHRRRRYGTHPGSPKDRRSFGVVIALPCDRACARR